MPPILRTRVKREVGDQNEEIKVQGRREKSVKRKVVLENFNDIIPNIKGEGDVTIKKEDEFIIQTIPASKEQIHIKKEYSDESFKDEKELTQHHVNSAFEIINISTIKSISSKEPKNWRDIYQHVQLMRANTIAPVDTMGCERLPEAISSTITPQIHRYQLLIALMLSAQTKDEVNAQAMATLRQDLKPLGGLTISSILQTEESAIDKMIFKVGFHNRKAKYIKQTSIILHEKYKDDIPTTIQEMISLPGVGPKMAHLLMHRAWGMAEGIGVDVHVHRLANMWGWIDNKKLQPTPERTREALESWLPKELWVDINPLLVGFGQTICLPRGRKCNICSLASSGLCKNVDRSKFKKGKIVDIEDLV